MTVSDALLGALALVLVGLALLAAVARVVDWWEQNALTAKLLRAYRLPLVRPTAWTVGKVVGALALTVAGSRLDAWYWDDGGRVVVPEETVCAQDDMPDDVADADRQPLDELPKPAAPARLPVVDLGIISHRGQPLSEFEESKKWPGYFNCIHCGQLGSFQKVKGVWQFVEAEPAE